MAEDESTMARMANEVLKALPNQSVRDISLCSDKNGKTVLLIVVDTPPTAFRFQPLTEPNKIDYTMILNIKNFPRPASPVFLTRKTLYNREKRNY